jgi:hypothetical protein
LKPQLSITLFVNFPSAHNKALKAEKHIMASYQHHHPFVEHIQCDGRLLAIILRTTYQSKGIEFFTPGDFSQQLGYMNRPQGYVISPHVHNLVPRQVSYTNEVLFIRSGCVRVDFYDDLQSYFESRILNPGDIILLAFGGHGFEMLEASEIIEVKQGPYAGESDKTRFVPISSEKLVFGEHK